MRATIIDGRAVAKSTRRALKKELRPLLRAGLTPTLAIILVGHDPASEVYVKTKINACAKIGIEAELIRFTPDISAATLLEKIAALNEAPQISGILVQLPLPAHLDPGQITAAISPLKDVDGLHPLNVGRVAAGKDAFAPCTALGIMALLEAYEIDPRGKDAVVIGRSAIVGRPTASLLLQANATVTLCHRHTADLHLKARTADILVSAVGIPHLVKGDWIKPGATVIDVGINRLPEGQLVGDVDFEAAQQVASYITPVPGGVGPMTVAMLLANLVRAAQSQASP